MNEPMTGRRQRARTHDDALPPIWPMPMSAPSWYARLLSDAALAATQPMVEMQPDWAPMTMLRGQRDDLGPTHRKIAK